MRMHFTLLRYKQRRFAVISMSSFVVKRGTVAVKEEGLRAFLWPKRWVVLREATLSFHKNEVDMLLTDSYRNKQ